MIEEVTELNRGRPTRRSAAVVAQLLERVANGESLAGVCRNADMPSRSTVHKWLADDPDFSDMYARACVIRVQVLCEEIIAIADGETPLEDDNANSSGPWPIEAIKLRIDARKWVVARMELRRYGPNHGREGAIANVAENSPRDNGSPQIARDISNTLGWR